MEIIHDLTFVIPLCIAIFFAIVFIQSGLDKVFDWKGNKSWLTSHFKETFLGSMVPLLLGTITVLEILAGLLSLVGGIYFLITRSTFWIEQGLILGMLTFLMLLFGQRIAKDYDGAKTIAIYMGVALISALLLLKL